MDTTPWLNPAEDRAWRAWLAMSERVRSQIARDLMSDSSLSDADYMVLVQLSEAADRRVRMTDLADRLNWSKSRLSHQLARMQSRGLVEREECPSDARGAFAVLGACGLAEIERAAPKHVASVRRHLIDVLEVEQLTQLATMAERVVDHLRNQGGCSGPPEDSRPTQPSGALDSTSEPSTLSEPAVRPDRAGWPAATDER
jgi:DNA-binding MarR family transcriptional regulator